LSETDYKIGYPTSWIVRNVELPYVPYSERHVGMVIISISASQSNSSDCHCHLACSSTNFLSPGEQKDVLAQVTS